MAAKPPEPVFKKCKPSEYNLPPRSKIDLHSEREAPYLFSGKGYIASIMIIFSYSSMLTNIKFLLNFWKSYNTQHSYKKFVVMWRQFSILL